MSIFLSIYLPSFTYLSVHAGTFNYGRVLVSSSCPWANTCHWILLDCCMEMCWMVWADEPVITSVTCRGTWMDQYWSHILGNSTSICQLFLCSPCYRKFDRVLVATCEGFLARRRQRLRNRSLAARVSGIFSSSNDPVQPGAGQGDLWFPHSFPIVLPDLLHHFRHFPIIFNPPGRCGRCGCYPHRWGGELGCVKVIFQESSWNMGK